MLSEKVGSLHLSHSSHEEPDKPRQRSRVLRLLDTHGCNSHATRSPIAEPTPYRNWRPDSQPWLAEQQHDQRQRRLQREQLRSLRPVELDA